MGISNVFNSLGGRGSSSSNTNESVEYSFTDKTSVTITHSFSSRPNVFIIDTQGNLVISEIRYLSSTQIIVNFAISLSGTIILR